MRNQYVLVDFENVQPQLEALVKLEHVHIVVLVGASQKSIPYEVVESMQALKERGQYVKLGRNGKNTLDFHIVFTIGQLAAKDPNGAFHIVSKDQDFDGWIDHMKGQKKIIYRVESTDQLPFLKAQEPPSLDAAIQMLQQMGKARPGKLEKLANSLANSFQRKPDDPEIKTLIQQLQSKKIITIEGSKVTYNLPAAT